MIYKEIKSESKTEFVFKEFASLVKSNIIGSFTAADDGVKLPYLSLTENMPSACIPVRAYGKYAIYIGFLGGTQEFLLNGERVFASYRDEIKPELRETFASVFDFCGESISLEKLREKAAYIAYLRFVPLDDEKYALWKSSDESKCFIVDNDGYSDFADGIFPNRELMCERAAGNFMRCADVGQFSFGTLVSCQHNFRSKTVKKYVEHRLAELGVPDSKFPDNNFTVVGRDGEPINFDDILRDVDRAAFRDMEYISREGAPADLVGEYCEGFGNGAKVIASLRMAAFYGDDAAFLNGSIYQLYPEWHLGDGVELSFANKEYRRYMLELVLEISSFSHTCGLMLDFGRYPYMFGSELTDISERRRIMLEFMRTVRAQMPAEKELIVRILVPEEEKALPYGLDFEEWMKEGLISRLITTEQSYESWYDFSRFVTMCHKYGVKYYLGMTSDLSGEDMTREQEILMKQGLWQPNNTHMSMLQFLERGYEGYMGGADGVYIFNGVTTGNVGGISPEYRALNNRTSIMKWKEFWFPAHMKGARAIERN